MGPPLCNGGGRPPTRVSPFVLCGWGARTRAPPFVLVGEAPGTRRPLCDDDGGGLGAKAPLSKGGTRQVTRPRVRTGDLGVARREP